MFYVCRHIMCVCITFSNCSVIFYASRLDYSGIALLIMGSFVPWLYYSFYCSPQPRLIYLSVVCVLGVAAIIVAQVDRFATPRHRCTRAGNTLTCSSKIVHLHDCFEMFDKTFPHLQVFSWASVWVGSFPQCTLPSQRVLWRQRQWVRWAGSIWWVPCMSVEQDCMQHGYQNATFLEDVTSG